MPGKKPTHTGRDATKEATGIKHEISIHAPHTGRDSGRCIAIASPMNFNPRAPYGARPLGRYYNGVISIHAPHTGRDYRAASCSRVASVFQSTRPIRGATAQSRLTRRHRPHFNPRAPYGARLICYDLSIAVPNFNPRAPYGARHVVAWRNTGEFAAFQSTRPIRGATMAYFPNTGRIVFQSTRPIRGATCGCRERMCATINFNPRAPYGARRRRYPRSGRACEFQSTRPIRGATAKMHNLCSAFLQQQTIKA